MREDERGGTRAGDRDVDADAAIRGLAAQFVGDGSRRTEQTLETIDVDRHDIVAVPLVARRKLARDIF